MTCPCTRCHCHRPAVDDSPSLADPVAPTTLAPSVDRARAPKPSVAHRAQGQIKGRVSIPHKYQEGSGRRDGRPPPKNRSLTCSKKKGGGDCRKHAHVVGRPFFAGSGPTSSCIIVQCVARPFIQRPGCDQCPWKWPSSSPRHFGWRRTARCGRITQQRNQHHPPEVEFARGDPFTTKLGHGPR